MANTVCKPFARGVTLVKAEAPVPQSIEDLARLPNAIQNAEKEAEREARQARKLQDKASRAGSVAAAEKIKQKALVASAKSAAAREKGQTLRTTLEAVVAKDHAALRQSLDSLKALDDSAYVVSKAGARKLNGLSGLGSSALGAFDAIVDRIIDTLGKERLGGQICSQCCASQGKPCPPGQEWSEDCAGYGLCKGLLDIGAEVARAALKSQLEKNLHILPGARDTFIKDYYRAVWETAPDSATFKKIQSTQWNSAANLRNEIENPKYEPHLEEKIKNQYASYQSRIESAFSEAELNLILENINAETRYLDASKKATLRQLVNERRKAIKSGNPPPPPKQGDGPSKDDSSSEGAIDSNLLLYGGIGLGALVLLGVGTAVLMRRR